MPERPALRGELDAETLQQALADRLVEQGYIQTAPVEAAFRAVPRHPFVPGTPLTDAYAHRSIPTHRRRGRIVSSASAPPIVATMLEWLQLRPGMRVLEIGAGTGFNAALMAQIVGPSGEVVTLDLDDEIVRGARAHLSGAGYERVRVLQADGAFGAPDLAPFDRVVLTAAATDVSPAWCAQLAPGGQLLLPLQLGGPLTQKLVAFERVGDHLASDGVGECVFLTMRGAQEQRRRSHRIGRLAGVRLTVPEGVSFGDARLDRLLAEPSQSWPTGIWASPRDLRGGLLFWLGLHEPRLCRLTVEGAHPGGEHVPALVPYPSSVPTAITVGLVDDDGAAFLSRAVEPATAPAQEEWLTPGEVIVRGFGSCEGLARQLVEAAVGWDAAGRRSGDGLRVHAYRRGSAPMPAVHARLAADPAISPNVLVVEKPSTTLVLTWG
ncbi:MAG: methyltransferase domain-containing protein [Chloroflexota bacterium]